MKVITLYQPYATLMMLGFKANETRGWKTNYRGELAIHAAASIPKWCKEMMTKEPFVTVLKGINLPTGKILGTVYVKDCVKIEDYLAKLESEMPYYTSEQRKNQYYELNFGDYSNGRYAWVTQHPYPYETPIAAKGFQGFWNYEPLAGTPEEDMIYGERWD